MSGDIFIENSEEYNEIKRQLEKDGYNLLKDFSYNDGIYTFSHCTKFKDTLIYKITARKTDNEGIDYLSEAVGWYVNKFDEVDD